LNLIFADVIPFSHLLNIILKAPDTLKFMLVLLF